MKLPDGSSLFYVTKQVDRDNVQSSGQLFQARKCDVTLSAFNTANVGPVKARNLGKALLGQTTQMSDCSHIHCTLLNKGAG